MGRRTRSGHVIVAEGWRAVALLVAVTAAAVGLALWAGNALVYGPSLPVETPSVEELEES